MEQLHEPYAGPEPPRPTADPALPSGVVTFLLTDIEGSSELWEAHPAAMPGVLERHDQLIGRVVKEQGGHLIKSKGEGDATLSVFRRATDAVTAAIALDQAIGIEPWADDVMPFVRIAIHTGEAHERDRDYFGPSVNRAARVRSLAAGGQILLSQVAAELVRDALPEDASLFDVGERALRGMARVEHVFELVTADKRMDEGVPDTEPSQPPLPETLALDPSAAFVGRSSELDRLSTSLKHAAQEGLRVVFAAGEPGIGKTRLCAEFARQAYDEGAVVLYGRCDEEPLVPFQPFVEGLRRWVLSLTPTQSRRLAGADHLGPLIPELASNARPISSEDPEVARFKFFEAVATTLEQATSSGPVLLVLDDLHWADRPTLQLLQHVMRTRTACPIMILGTYRETDLTRTKPLAAMLSDFRRERAFERIALSGLAEEEILELLQRSAAHEVGSPGRALAKALSETTEGNPFFIEQIIGSLIDGGRLALRDGRWTLDARVEDLGIPEGVIEAIGRRLSRLSDQCNKALAAASVLGRDFEVDVLTRVLGADPEEVLASIEEALQVGLIKELPGRGQASCTFSHALVQQALYEELSLARKQRLHLKAAQSIEEARPSSIDSYVTTLARHLREAGAAADPEKAIDYSARAMEAASRVFAFDDGISHGEAALELMEETQVAGTQAARLHERLGDMRYVAGLEYDRSFAHYEAALREYGVLKEDKKVARVHVKLGRGLSTYPDVADINRALEHLHAAKDILGPTPDPKLEGPLSLNLAVASMWFADPATGLEHAQRAVEIGREQSSEAVWATGTAIEAWALSMMGRFDRSVELHDSAWEVADRLDNVLPAFAAAWSKCNGYTREPREHSNLAIKEFEKPRQAQTTRTRDSLRATAAGALACAGEMAEARALLKDSQMTGVVTGPGIVYFSESFADDLPLHLEALSQRESQGLRWSQLATLVYLLGPLQWAMGELDGARASFESAIDLSQKSCYVEEFEARTRLASIEALEGNHEQASKHLTRLNELEALGRDWRGFLGTASTARALVAGGAGNHGEAQTLFEDAIDNFKRFGLPFGEAETLYLWGRSLAGSDPTRALDRFDAALEIFTSRDVGKAWIDLVEGHRHVALSLVQT